MSSDSDDDWRAAGSKHAPVRRAASTSQRVRPTSAASIRKAAEFEIPDAVDVSTPVRGAAGAGEPGSIKSGKVRAPPVGVPLRTSSPSSMIPGDAR